MIESNLKIPCFPAPLVLTEGAPVSPIKIFIMANCNHPLSRLIFLLDNTKKNVFFQEQDISESNSLSIGPLQTRPGFKGSSATY